MLTNLHSNFEVSLKYIYILFELMHFFKFRTTLPVEFLNLQIFIQTQKYTSSRLSKQMYLFSNSEVYLKQTFYTYVFMFKLRSTQEVYRFSKLMYFFSIFRSILEVDLLNLCIHVQTQKYIGSRFSKLMYFFSIFEVYLKQNFNIDVLTLKLRSIH